MPMNPVPENGVVGCIAVTVVSMNPIPGIVMHIVIADSGAGPGQVDAMTPPSRHTFRRAGCAIAEDFVIGDREVVTAKNSIAHAATFAWHIIIGVLDDIVVDRDVS